MSSIKRVIASKNKKKHKKTLKLRDVDENGSAFPFSPAPTRHDTFNWMLGNRRCSLVSRNVCI